MPLFDTANLRPYSGPGDVSRILHFAGEHEADAVQAVHAGAFGRAWQPGEYLQVMRSPSFQSERELVVVAPDGRFAAFLVYWLDPITRSGLTPGQVSPHRLPSREKSKRQPV